MKIIAKWALYLVIAVVLIAVIGISYIMLALPNVGEAENIKVELTPQRIERGKYLAIHVSACMDCHSPHDWTKFGGPVDSTRLGAGGQKFNKDVGFPGEVSVPNITPFNLSSWTDGEIFRAITSGVKKDGSAIFPLMPWMYYSKMDRQDIYSIIAYLRSLKPQNTSYPKSKLDFPLNILVHTMPVKANVGNNLPDNKNIINYGAYLVQAAACKDCHSQDKQVKILPGLEFAGGHEYQMNGNTLRSANITPDKSTGIGNWTKADFIARFRVFNDESKAAQINGNDFQTIMPWWGYNKLSDDDLSAIYAYLQTVKPVNNKVLKWQVNSSAKQGSSN